jgi:hypothetical protein
MAAVDASEPTKCQACGRRLVPGLGRLTRVRKGVIRSLCPDCEELMAPPDSAFGRGSPPSGLQAVDEFFMAADPHAATVELPPPKERRASMGPSPIDTDRTLSKAPPRRKSVDPRLRLALYVALATLAGIVTGVLILAIVESLS